MVTLRPMLSADIDVMQKVRLSPDWDVSREFLAFATSQPACSPMVVDIEGTIVATGVGTLSGPVGWIGTIFVTPDRRGQGIGRAITQAIIDRLEAGGARTLVLVATADGRRLYSKMGFEVQTRYRILEASGLAPGSASPQSSGAGRVRPFEPADVDAMAALDREGTGEDRRHVLARFANPESSRVLPGRDGSIDGFVVRAPWGGGATIARSWDAAAAIIADRRRRSGPEGRVRVGVLQENVDGLARLAESGFTASWSAPRMIRGETLDWHPDWIWGQYNHAIG